MSTAATALKPSCATGILIVEDEGVVALYIRTQLLKLGHTVSGVCATGEEALRVIAENKPALILMDIRIQGDLDGIEVARRAQNEYDIPVIFLTASTDSKTVERAHQTNPFGYLAKPFHPVSLAASIEIALSTHRAQSELRRQRAWLASILGNMADGVIATDGSGSVQFMNSEAERLTGWPIAEARNQPFPAVLPIRDLTAGVEVDDLVPHAIRNQRGASIPNGLHAQSRTQSFPVEGEIAPAPADMPYRCIITFRNISERLSNEKETMALLVPRDPRLPAALDEETNKDTMLVN